MDDKIYLMLKEAGFDTGFQNTFIANNSAKFDKFVELIREDQCNKSDSVCDDRISQSISESKRSK